MTAYWSHSFFISTALGLVACAWFSYVSIALHKAGYWMTLQCLLLKTILLFIEEVWLQWYNVWVWSLNPKLICVKPYFPRSNCGWVAINYNMLSFLCVSESTLSRRSLARVASVTSKKVLTTPVYKGKAMTKLWHFRWEIIWWRSKLFKIMLLVPVVIWRTLTVGTYG